MHEPTLKQALQAAITHGPVLIVAPMATPDHTNTNSPITDNSPLIRAALLATNLGASRLVFNPAERHAAVIYLTMHGSKLEMQQVLQLGAVVPAVGFRWCSLNAGFFCDEIVVWGQVIKPWTKSVGGGQSVHVLELGAPRPANFDPEFPAHAACIEQVLGYFQAQGWARAAELCPPVYATATSEVLPSTAGLTDPTPRVDPAEIAGARAHIQNTRGYRASEVLAFAQGLSGSLTDVEVIQAIEAHPNVHDCTVRRSDSGERFFAFRVKASEHDRAAGDEYKRTRYEFPGAHLQGAPSTDGKPAV